jgi:hypothetical protein
MGIGVGGGIALAGLLSAGATAYGASTASSAASTLQGQKLKTYKPTTIPVTGVQTVNPGLEASSAIGYNKDNLASNEGLDSSTNSYNYQQALHYYNKIQPYFSQLQSQIGQNALQASQGQLPSDVISQIQRTTAAQGIQAGIGYGSQGGKSGALGNLYARNLGLTSLQQQQYGNTLGMQASQQAQSLLPQLMTPQQMMVTPAAEQSGAEFNAGQQNQVALANMGATNQAAAVNAGAYNALNQNIGQAGMAGQLAAAQIASSGGTALAGLLGKAATTNSGANAFNLGTGTNSTSSVGVGNTINQSTGQEVTPQFTAFGSS